jgi:hypothetical protein
MLLRQCSYRPNALERPEKAIGRIGTKRQAQADICSPSAARRSASPHVQATTILVTLTRVCSYSFSPSGSTSCQNTASS